MWPLQEHRSSHCLLVPSHRPGFIIVTTLKQLLVELGQVPSLRHWNPMVAPEGANFTFDATLLMTLPRGAELRGEPPVGAKRDKPGGLLPSGTPQYPLHCRSQVVVAEPLEDPAKMVQGVFVSV